MSNDNAFAESLFRTCKYRPNYPVNGFKTLDEALAWVLSFVHWCNAEHKHSSLKFTTPQQRHTGEATKVVEHRNRVYEAAKAQRPDRWSGSTRNWRLPSEVWLNPEKPLEDIDKAA